MPSAHTAREYRLLRWIRRRPLPAKLLGETLSGEEVKVVVTGESKAAFADAVTSLDECWRILALDKDGNQIRKFELDRTEREEEEEAAPRPGQIISIDVPKLVDNIARNMREVAITSANQQATAFKEGFAAMTQVVNLCLSLLVRVDQRLEQAEVGTTTAPGDDRHSLAMLAIQKALGGNTTAPPPAPTNGGATGFQLSPDMIQALVAQFSGNAQSGDDHGTG
jgi:hypothetical protein